MNYTKPEVAVLGQAVRVIECPRQGGILDFDGTELRASRL